MVSAMVEPVLSPPPRTRERSRRVGAQFHANPFFRHDKHGHASDWPTIAWGFVHFSYDLYKHPTIWISFARTSSLPRSWNREGCRANEINPSEAADAGQNCPMIFCLHASLNVACSKKRRSVTVVSTRVTGKQNPTEGDGQDRGQNRRRYSYGR